ncbi:MAG TPA: hypothetical protein VND65_19965 [Candidatus Binatia bacterium]|nr:hypothetical protein [Candidatus Binatia bacterium]
MPDSQGGDTVAASKEERYLLSEYDALIKLDGARNERLDRFLTTFVSLAAAPWALYALTIKESSTLASFDSLPVPVAAALLLIGVLGALVVMMYIQVWFNIVLYMRAVNAIRGYFLETNTRLGFRLPTNPNVPPYYAKGSYLQLGVAGMALVNSAYIGLGLFNLIAWPRCSSLRVFVFVIVAALCWIGHLVYFSSQGGAREGRSPARGELHWGK